MASNFFEQQDVARKKTGQLVGLFMAAVVGIILLIYGLVYVFFLSGDPGPGQPDKPVLGAFIATVVVVVAVVGGSTLWKVASLRSGGGESVAQAMGGRRLHMDTTDRYERQVLNVVEEMALASGTSVPPVYVMDHESGINAFAAGYTPEGAVISVTRGSIEQLSRDELQGVIAHEFSHILNGDMRLNIRLMGVIFGIIAIGVIGRVLLRSIWFTGSSRRRGKDDGKAAIAIALFGLCLIIIGFIGVFFGRLIQAAVSRQREYLADASAVQFTRNPDSIGGALKRIGGFGSEVKDGHAGEISHMFIASAASSWGFGPFATHPPIIERIKRIDPNWDGTYPQPRVVMESGPEESAKRSSPNPLADGGPGNILGGLPGAVVGGAIIAGAAGGQQGGGAAPTASAVDQIGRVSPDHLAYMRELLAKVPDPINRSAREPYGARAVVYTMLLDRDRSVRDKQLEHLAQHADQAVHKLTVQLTKSSKDLSKSARLPLIDLAIPALREMSDKQYEAFKQNVDVLVQADGRTDLFEWVLQRLLLRHLDGHFNPAPDPNVRYYALKPVVAQCSLVLSALAQIGQREQSDAQAAFDLGGRELGVQGLTLLSRKQLQLTEVGKALDELIHASPREKQKLIRGCAKTIAADGEVNRGEGELMRGVADSLGVPMPPLLPGQTLV